MSTEVWFRNPSNFIRECVELREFNYAWDRGLLVKKKLDPKRYVELYVAPSDSYRMLLIGDQGAAELDRDTEIDSPRAVYPVWDFMMDTADALESLIATPCWEDDHYTSKSLPPDERAVVGQEHRVIVTRVPPAGGGIARRFYMLLAELQAEYPDCIVHAHNLYSYPIAFGKGFRSVDIDPRASAQKGKIQLPSGKEIKYEQAVHHTQWITVLGYKPVELQVPRNRCMYNMKSAQWAAEHWHDKLKFKSTGKHEVDPTAIDSETPVVSAIRTGSKAATVGDRILCDVCSLQNSCKYFRSGEVCAIPGSEPARLATMFQSRDPDVIIDGLGTVLAAQTNRLERGIDHEEEYGGPNDSALDPAVTALANSIVSNGVKLAKLLAPARFSPGAKIAVGIQMGNSAVQAATPAALVAGVMAQIEAQGIPRSEITSEMIEAFLRRAEPIDVAALPEGHDADDDDR